MLRGAPAWRRPAVAIAFLSTVPAAYAQPRTSAPIPRTRAVVPSSSHGSSLAVHQLEQIVGRPLTSEQETEVEQAVTIRNAAIRAAMEQFYQSIARAIGMTPQELREKARNLTGGSRRSRRGGDANTPPAPAATAPGDTGREPEPVPETNHDGQ